MYIHLHDHPEAKKGVVNGPVTVTSEFPTTLYVCMCVTMYVCMFVCLSAGEQQSSEVKKAQRKERKAKAKAQAQEEKKGEEIIYF